MLKRPKDIESDMLSGGLVFLFRALEIYRLTVMVSGKRGTAAKINNAQA